MNDSLGVSFLFGAALFLALRIREKPFRRFVASLRRLGTRLFERKEAVRIERAARMMEQSGCSKTDAGKWITFRNALFVSVPAFMAIPVVLGAPPLPCVCLGICVILLPGFLLKRGIRKRRREILLALPFYLDLLTLTLEAGLDLVASLDEIVRNDRPNALAEEIRILLTSIRLGKTRTEAFSDLARRTGLEALSTLSGCVRQSEELGAGLGKLLRLQAESLRRDLYREAEERAQRAPVRMLFPLILCIFPVVFLLLIVPIALRLTHAF
ncbi:MAG: type II secretion system F family protein [Pseudomonadota bacterium]